MLQSDKEAEMGEMVEKRYRIDGMDCASCAAKIDTAVRRMPGVEDVSVSVTAGTMTLRHDGSSDLVAIERKVTSLGYSVSQLAGRLPAETLPASHAHHDHDHADHDHAGREHAEQEQRTGALEGLHGYDAPMAGPWWQSKKGRLTILSGAALVVAYVVGHLVPAIAAYAFVVAMLVGLVPIARRAVVAAFAGTPLSLIHI